MTEKKSEEWYVVYETDVFGKVFFTNVTKVVADNWLWKDPNNPNAKRDYIGPFSNEAASFIEFTLWNGSTST